MLHIKFLLEHNDKNSIQSEVCRYELVNKKYIQRLVRKPKEVPGGFVTKLWSSSKILPLHGYSVRRSL